VSNILTISTFTVDTTTTTTDTTAPVLTEVYPVTTPTSNSTPYYTFHTTEAGTITYGGSCSSTTINAYNGNNNIRFNTLSDGTYSDENTGYCTITVKDSAGNVSNTLTISTFTVDTTPPSVISISPAQGVDNVSVVSTTGFEFGFNEEINPSTILTNSNSATCDGYSATIQTSPDNFSTNTNCIQLGTATTSDNKTFRIIPTNLINSLCPTFYSSSCGSNLMPDTNYQIKVTSQVKELAGNTLNGGNDNLSNFTSKARPYVSSTSPDNGSIVIAH